MPDKTISILGASAVVLLGLYLILVGLTVSFVSTQTQVSSAMHRTENAISSLEKDYYAQISAINDEKPSTYGLVAPKTVSYVSAPLRPALSSAQN